MSPSSDYAELELMLATSGSDAYRASVRFWASGKQAETQLLVEQSEPIVVRFDERLLLGVHAQAESYGRLIGNMLFADNRLARAFQRACDLADGAGVGLRLRLHLAEDAERLHNLRWETLVVPGHQLPLSQSERIVFSRFLGSSDARTPVTPSVDTLQAVLVAANPADLPNFGMAPIDATTESRRARAALGEHVDLVERIQPGEATLDEILAQMRRCDVLYLVCHGRLSGGEAQLYLDDGKGRIQGVRGGELAQRVLALSRTPRLIVLASCQSAGDATNDDGVLAAIGPLLVQAGVPAVIAMQGNVLMETVEVFMSRFFAELARDGVIDRALAVARVTVRKQPDWWTPVLFMRLTDGRLFRPSTVRATLIDVPCPYRGLEYFDVDHAAYFFGRAKMVLSLAGKVAINNFIAVVGPSGCGKSSLVRAGLIHKLKGGAFSDSNAWLIEIIKPGDDPLRSLCAALVRHLSPTGNAVDQMTETARIADEILQGRLSLGTDIAAYLRLANPGAPHFVLVIDQFEEIFDPRVDEKLRTAFIDSLLGGDGGGWFKIILTLRADFFNAVLQHRTLGEKVATGLVTVLPMSREERRSAIEQPALATGRSFEPGLVDRILDAVEASPGDLPLLEFALTQLWEQQTASGLLTHAGYEIVGEISGSIAHHASTVFESMSDPQKEHTHHLFVRLVRIDQEVEEIETLIAQAANRRIRLDDLDDDKQELVRTILTKQRLVITGRTQATGEETVELVHEALIRNWPQLRTWLTEDPTNLRIHQALTEAVQIWRRFDCDADLLYRGERLHEVLKWQKTHHDELNEQEEEFLRSSRMAQLRQRLLLFGLIAITTVAMLFVVRFVLYPLNAQPTEMPVNHYNIAVAPFQVHNNQSVDTEVASALQRDAEDFAQQTTELLHAQEQTLAVSGLGKEVTIWGPQQFTIDVSNPASITQRMQDANVNLLLYGEIEPDGGKQWLVRPKLYVIDNSLQGRASEALTSAYLGQPIEYLPGNLASNQVVENALQERLEVLNRLIVGLSHYDLANSDGYTAAKKHLCSTSTSTAAAKPESGQELLHLFCGHANLMLAWRTETSAEQDVGLLNESTQAYEQGLVHAPENVRLLTSLGAVLLRRGAPTTTGCTDGNMRLLEEAQEFLQHALTAMTVEDDSETPQITIMEAHNALGEAQYWLGTCFDTDHRAEHWSRAQIEFDKTMTLHKTASGRSDLLDKSAATAYLHSGLISLFSYWYQAYNQPDTVDASLIQNAISEYDNGINLLMAIRDEETTKIAVDHIHFLLLAHCMIDDRTQAKVVLDSFLELVPQPESTRSQVFQSLESIVPGLVKGCEL
jgi:energy-coupling factor transporter ATP-binding protein EcfA2